ncbi:MAG: peptidylprolyl isomerase, partial [Methanoregula sp.]
MTLQRIPLIVSFLVCILLLTCGCTQPAGTPTAQSPAVTAPGSTVSPQATNVSATATREHVLLETTMGN